MSLMAARGTPIPGDVNVYAATLVLPFNSALNPFLYTLKTILENREKVREAKRRQVMMNSLQNDVSAWPQDQLRKFLASVFRFV